MTQIVYEHMNKRKTNKQTNVCSSHLWRTGKARAGEGVAPREQSSLCVTPWTGNMLTGHGSHLQGLSHHDLINPIYLPKSPLLPLDPITLGDRVSTDEFGGCTSSRGIIFS
jgi:hypothetical protein